MIFFHMNHFVVYDDLLFLRSQFANVLKQVKTRVVIGRMGEAHSSLDEMSEDSAR